MADKLPDAVNLAVGALFFGQFLTDRPFSIEMAFAGNLLLVRAPWMGARVRKEEERMIGIYIMRGGMVLFATVIGVWDLVGHKRRRREIPRGGTNPESPLSNPQE